MIDDAAGPGTLALRPRVLGDQGDAPSARTLLDIFTATVQSHPDEPAVDDGRNALSYREFAAAAEELADRLAEAGVGRGDRVPVDADDPDERARLVFREAGVAHVLSSVTPPPGAASRTARLPPGPGDDAWIIFTSGSTGTPKGVAVSHRSAAAFVDAEARLFLRKKPVKPGDRVLAGLSVAFDASCEEMWLAWRNGACLVPAPRSLVRSGVDLGPWLVDQRITIVSTVPTLAALWPHDCLAGVRLLF